jgi:hypothetical protein
MHRRAIVDRRRLEQLILPARGGPGSLIEDAPHLLLATVISTDIGKFRALLFVFFVLSPD